MIKENFRNSSEALYNLGVAYLNKMMYAKAKECLVASNELKRYIFTEFLIIVAEVHSITQRRAAIFTITDSERATLSNAYNKLTSGEINEFFNKAVIELKREYWLARISILLFIDKKEAYQQIEALQPEIKNSSEFKILIADTLILNNARDKALTILQEVYSQNKQPELLIKILNVFIAKGENDKVIEMYKGLKEEDFDKDGYVAATILEVIADVEGIEKANEEAKRFIDENSKPFFLFHSLGIINLEKGNIETGLEMFTKLVKNIPSDNFPPRAIFAEDMLKYEFNDLALVCLKPFTKYNEKAEFRYVHMLIASGDELKLSEAERILNDKIAQQEVNQQLLKLKVDLLYKTNRKHAALLVLDKLIELDSSVSHAYNAVVLKMELGERDFLKYIKILEHDENNPISLITAGLCYKAEGNYERARQISYKALALNRDTLNDSTIDFLYGNFIGINLFPEIPDGENEKADLDEIEINSAYEIINESKKVWLAIDSDNILFNGEETLNFIGAVHYKSDSPKIIGHIGAKLNDTIKYEGETFKVKQITTLKARAIRYCIDIYTLYRPDSQIFKGVRFDESHPMTSFMPMLFEMEKHQKDLLEQYNLKNKIGIPLWLISKQFGQNLLDGIFYILNKTNQVFYAGEVVLFNPKDASIVLSPSSILFLHILDVFDSVKSISNKICVSDIVRDYFIRELEKINVQDKRVKMTVGIENGKPFVSEITENHLRSRREFFAGIVNNLNDLQIINSNIDKTELDKHSQIIKLITLPEFTGIYLADSISGIYICDDLVVRKTSNILLQKKITTNVVGILYLLFKDNLDLLFDHLDKLAKSNYVYVYNDLLLLSIIDEIIKQKKILGPETLYGRLQKLIHYSLNTPQQLGYYEPILLNVISIIYRKGIDEYTNYIIKSILREVWLYYSLYIINDDALLKKLASISDSEKDFNYFKSILIEIKKGNLN